jgi:hypothetical protein
MADKTETKLAQTPREARQAMMAQEFGRKAKEGYHFVRNLHSGGVVELKDGTPNCCDPSSETYWAM